MLDYSLSDFQRSDFILNYDIDVTDNTIMVNYANDKSMCIPYTKENEIMLLKRMKNQVLQSGKFYEIVKGETKKYNRLDRLYKIMFAIYGGLLIGLAIKEIIAALLFFILTLPVNIRNIKKFKHINMVLKGLKRTLNDYEKNVDFIENMGSFTNDKVMRPYVISNMSEKVQYVISMGIVNDKYNTVNFENDEIPYVNYELTNPDDIEHEKRLLEEGYVDASMREIPYLNENTIDSLSYDDLAKIEKLTMSSNNMNGKVLVKLKKYNSNQIER